MPLAEDIISAAYSIQAYDSSQITINGQGYRDSLVLTPTTLIHPWPVRSIADLNEQVCQDIFAQQPDVVLLGTGDRQIFPDISIIGLFAKQGLGLEVMNTGALCRTFNILVAEGRQATAAIIQS
jgi:uncharacterized protein